jgi:hypothetical protein
MRTWLIGGLILTAAGVLTLALGTRSGVTAEEKSKKMLAHNVFFALNDKSAAAKQKLVAACKKYLSKHDGEVFFAAGTLNEELNRPVNDRDFDVGLHIVFKDKASHDKYQDAERHLKFIEENKDNWKKVRVFDSDVEQ